MAAAAAAVTGFLVSSPLCGKGKLGLFAVPWLVFGSGERSSARWLCCSGVQGLERSPAVKSVAPQYVGQGCKLIGCGSAVPKLIVSNNDLANIVETSDEWISTRTGIRNRRVLSGEESLTALAVEASIKALQMAQIEPDDVDLILMCTSTPNDLFGSGPQIQRALGCRNNPWSIDIRAACSGFIAGLLSAAGHIRGLGYRNVLVVGADALSRYVDWTDRGSCILFGDAAGAAVVQACDGKEDSLLGFDTNSDGDGQRHLSAPIKDQSKQESKLATNGAVGFPPILSSNSCIQMNGQEVFRFAVRCVPASVEKSLEKAGLASSDLDWLLLHQANQRIIDLVASRLQISPENVLSNLANYGNTSAASIPLALDEAVRGGKIKPGDTIAMAGFGAGLSWGSAIVRWGSAT